MPSPSERIPPQSIEAEMSLLGSILLDQESMIRIADILESTDFYHKKHSHIYETMGELYEKNEPIDILTLGNR
ncbi:MAG: DnaB-like helicase N-terminal domain-containing protein, partial [Candidatus Magasanikbacteria bacterium]